MRPVCQTVGIEVELLAPPGSSRKALAESIANTLGGSVRTVFHLDSEPSKVNGKPIFYHLTQGFEILDAQGVYRAQCVDDITLQRDLDKRAPAQAGWYRIVSDEVRLLRLLQRHTSAAANIAESLQALGHLFGTVPEATEKGVYRLQDEWGASLALAAPLPGERERACELVTAPLAADDRETLPMMLGCARELGFLLPNEGATHLHFDADPFCSAPVLARLVDTLHQHRADLRKAVKTNPYCRRLGAWPDTLLEVVRAPDFSQLDWETARQRLIPTRPAKYCDFNLRNLILNVAGKHTLEVRILPATLCAADIFTAIDLFQAVFAQTLNPPTP